jgi:aryl carrier-like protein
LHHAASRYWQTPAARKFRQGAAISGGGAAQPQSVPPSSQARDTVESWLGRYELSEYAEGVKGAGYTSIRFLKAATQEDLEEVASEIGMKKVHMKVFLAAWEELLQTAEAETHVLQHDSD